MCKFVFVSFLKIFIMSLRIRSVFCLDVFLKTTSPSSLYNPVDCLSSLFDSNDSIWMLTSLQISTSSEVPMVTSKLLSVFFSFQGSLSLYNKDFLQSFIIRKSFFGMSLYCWANRTALCKICQDVDG